MGLLMGKPGSITLAGLRYLDPWVAVGPGHNTFHCRYSHKYSLNSFIYLLLVVTTSNLSYYWNNYSELDVASQS
jgi:hypothetical protein